MAHLAILFSHHLMFDWITFQESRIQKKNHTQKFSIKWNIYFQKSFLLTSEFLKHYNIYLSICIEPSRFLPIRSYHCIVVFLNLQRTPRSPAAIYCYRELFALRQRSILSWRENPVWSMAPVFHTADNAPGFIMSSVQSPCLPLLSGSLSPTPVHPLAFLFCVTLCHIAASSLWGEAVQNPYPPEACWEV